MPAAVLEAYGSHWEWVEPNHKCDPGYQATVTQRVLDSWRTSSLKAHILLPLSCFTTDEAISVAARGSTAAEDNSAPPCAAASRMWGFWEGMSQARLANGLRVATCQRPKAGVPGAFGHSAACRCSLAAGTAQDGRLVPLLDQSCEPPALHWTSRPMNTRSSLPGSANSSGRCRQSSAPGRWMSPRVAGGLMGNMPRRSPRQSKKGHGCEPSSRKRQPASAACAPAWGCRSSWRGRWGRHC